MVVIVVIGILAALLLPAIAGAVRRANEAAVQAEISQMTQALADFKSKYGDFPPSRIMLIEDGGYGIVATSPPTYSLTGAGDISDQDLATRSLRYLRKFWPRVQFSTVPSVPVIQAPYNFNSNPWYDFNGNSATTTAPDPPYVLSGDECLAFFLGGLPRTTAVVGGPPKVAMVGFGRNPINPFTLGQSNRQPPLLEFKGRLVDTDKDGMPSYMDPLKTSRPYAYFSAYGGVGYDPNDMNVAEEDDEAGPGPASLKFSVAFPVQGGSPTTSAAPNPYSDTVTVGGTVIWEAAQTYQIISAGYDGLYGVGGQFAPSSSERLPLDSTNTSPKTTRQRERDNISSIASGRLD